jgi:hypothetical protein
MAQDKWNKANIDAYLISLILLPLSAFLANISVAEVRNLWVILIEEQKLSHLGIYALFVHVDWIWFASVAGASIFAIAFSTFYFHNVKSLIASCVIMIFSFGFNIVALLLALNDLVRLSTTL